MSWVADNIGEFICDPIMSYAMNKYCKDWNKLATRVDYINVSEDFCTFVCEAKNGVTLAMRFDSESRTLLPIMIVNQNDAIEVYQGFEEISQERPATFAWVIMQHIFTLCVGGTMGWTSASVKDEIDFELPYGDVLQTMMDEMFDPIPKENELEQMTLEDAEYERERAERISQLYEYQVDVNDDFDSDLSNIFQFCNSEVTP